MIATVDKFATLPWEGRTAALFGRVDRFDNQGFYGPSEPGIGTALPAGRLAPPDLVIQDELHLISGPLGTMVGLYESAIDELSSVRQSGKGQCKNNFVFSWAAGSGCGSWADDVAPFRADGQAFDVQ